MTNPPKARIARVTQAAPGEPLFLDFGFAPNELRTVDIAVDGSRFERIEINMHQLRNIVADGAKMLEVK